MTTNKFITRLLRMKGFRAKDFWFTRNTLDIIVRPWKNGCRCPLCDCRGKIKRQFKERRIWNDVRVCQWKVRFFYSPKEIICPTHGRIQEKIPWAEPNARVSSRLEYCVLSLAARMPQSDAANLLDLPSSTFSDILHRAINRCRDGHRIRDLRAIGIDEISYCKGHKYATVVYDLDRSKVVWVGKGKKRETIDSFFENHLSLYQKKKIKFGVCDMSTTFMDAIKDHCPNAVLVIDRFHVAKALNEALDEVRKEEWRKLLAEGDKEGRKVLKGMRWALFRHSTNRTDKDRRILKHLEKTNKRIYRAWVLKDELEQLWSYVYSGAAENFAKAWITRTLRSRLEPMKKFARTLRNHLPNVLSFIGPRITNAVAEGINRVIRIVKNRACGYKTFDAFTDIIYLVVGDLDIPACIPAKHRTI